MIDHSPSSNHTQSAFTLEEVLVSLAILGVLTILLIGTIDGASNVWLDGKRRHEAVREAKQGLQMITQDLHSAVLTTNEGSFLIQSNKPNESSPASCQRLFFLSSESIESRQPDSKGDLCAIGYFIANSPQDESSLNLYRFHASSDQVVEAIEHGGLRTLYELASPAKGGNTELVARNILDLEIHSLPEQCPHPEILAISLSAINGDTARLISSDPGAAERNARLIQRYLQHFSAFVHLPPRRDTPKGF